MCVLVYLFISLLLFSVAILSGWSSVMCAVCREIAARAGRTEERRASAVGLVQGAFVDWRVLPATAHSCSFLRRHWKRSITTAWHSLDDAAWPALPSNQRLKQQQTNIHTYVQKTRFTAFILERLFVAPLSICDHHHHHHHHHHYVMLQGSRSYSQK